MMRIITTILLMFSSYHSIAQNVYFDSIYRITAQELIASDPEQALDNVDLLYSISKTNYEELRSLLLKAALLRTYGLNNEALNLLLKSDSIASIEKDYVSLTRINGLVATIYRESNLNSAATIYFKKAKEAIEKIEDENLKNRFRGNIEQEGAQIEMKMKNFQKAIAHIRKSNKYFLLSGSRTDIPYHLSSNNGQIARIYLMLEQTDSAFYYLEKSQNQLSEAQSANSPKKGFIFNGFAETYLAIGSYDLAEEYFLKAKTIAEESNYFELKKEVYFKLSDFYKKIEQNEKYIEINEQYLKLINDDKKARELVSDALIKNLYEQELNSKNKQRINSKIITLLIISVFLLITILSWYIYNKRKNQKKFQLFLEKKYKQKEVIIPVATVSKQGKSYMSVEKEESILKSLEDMEKTEFYLKEDISLNVFSGKMGINQRYLTYVIKKHKNTDFANYINELRINYIVNCIKTDPKYLLYKISYLAEQCGFASHSRFSINFKKVTGTTPSAFINYVREENEKESSKTD